MEEIVLNAEERIKQKGKFKEPGYIPGVIYGHGIKESLSIKFKEKDLKDILAKHGSNAKVWINYNSDKKFGFVKEIQRHPVSNQIIHVDVQLVSMDQDIKLQIPLSFKGESLLRSKQLQLQVNKFEVDVTGPMPIMPNVIEIDISEMELGDTITKDNFDLDERIKITDDEDEIYASIIDIIITEVDEPEVDKDDEDVEGEEGTEDSEDTEDAEESENEDTAAE